MMKCHTCNRLMQFLGTNTNKYECPFCGGSEVKRAGVVVAQTASGVVSVPKQSHPKHE